MALHIRTVDDRKDLKTFVTYPFKLYKGCPQWVPPLIRDEMATFDPAENPVYESAESRLFLAVRGNEVVGRIAAILSHAANQKYKTRNVRFGWLDLIEDYAVAEALFSAVRDWAKARGSDTLTGPHGFSNFDRQGMLIQGFEHRGTIHALYNYPYYPTFAEKYGFEKDVDYIEIKSVAPENGLIDPRYRKIKERIEKTNKVHLLRFKTKKEAVTRSREIFSLLNQTYAEIYGVIPLTEKHIDYLTKKFISFINKDLINIATNRDGEMIGLLITMPSLAKGFQRARGRLLPFGWYHIMRRLKRNDKLDLLLIAARPEHQKRGVPILMLADLAQRVVDMGYRSSESAPMLENNQIVHSLHKYFDSVVHKRRRIFKLAL